MNVLHLSQTDIRSDSRILKEMTTVAKEYKEDTIYGIGTSMNEGTINSPEIDNLNIYSIDLVSRKFKFLPKILIHILNVLEILFKMFFKSLKCKPQIIHCHDTPVLPLGILLKLFTKAKVIYDAHELESNRNGLNKTSGKLTLFVEKFLWKYIDSLIVVSPSIDKWYQDNIGEKYSKVIMNSPIINIEDNKFDKNYLRNKFDIDVNAKIFIYIGILGEGRGIDLIIEAFKKDKVDSHVVFLGYGDLKEELEKLSSTYPNIHLHDAVSHDKVVPIAKSADVGLCLIQNVSLSDYYCLPNKLFEYSFGELPILASKFPDIERTVEKFNLGKCCELNLESIIESINEFENSDELPVIDSKDLYELSWPAQEENIIELYQYIKNKII